MIDYYLFWRNLQSEKNCFASQQVSHDTRQSKILFPVLLDLKHINKI